MVSKTYISTWDQVADCLLTQWDKTKGGQDVRDSGNSPSKTAWGNGSITTRWFGKTNPAQSWGECELLCRVRHVQRPRVPLLEGPRSQLFPWKLLHPPSAEALGLQFAPL